MPNLLNTKIDYQIVQTRFGTWKRYLYENGCMYREFTSRDSVAGLPLVHIAGGRNPETGKVAVARGVIAIGRVAVGILAIGQAAFGVFAFGQVAVSVLIGIGQLALGVVAVGQGAGGVFVLGQFAAGVIAIGQFAIGGWVRAQFGFGRPLWLLLRQ